MSEYIVDGAEPNSTVLKSTTSNGYEHEKWLPVREEIVRCRDCVKFSEQEPNGEIGTCELGLEDTGLVSIVEPNGFCAWAVGRWTDD